MGRTVPRATIQARWQVPLFLGCSERDFHIPKERVELSAEVLQEMGGVVTARLYSDMSHTINQDEIRAVQRMMTALLEQL